MTGHPPIFPDQDSGTDASKFLAGARQPAHPPVFPDQDSGTDASKFLAGARQAAPTGTGPEITPLVIKDLEERYRYGKDKYGEGLRANNGRDPLIDLYQELLDAVLYTRQALEEKYGNQAQDNSA